MKKKILILTIIISLFMVSLTTYTIYRIAGTHTTTISTANFSYEVTTNQVNLKNSITNSKPLAPGAEGKIVLNIDLSNMEVESDYEIMFKRDNIPTNLKFYSDSNKTNEIQKIEGSYTLSGSTSISHDIYWKWIYNDSTESNTNDSLFMDEDIQVIFNVTFIQKIGGGN